jgi:ribosomal protein S18 acetylase RimI-like enzyme
VERFDRELAVVREASEVDIDAFVEFFVAAWRQSGPEAPGFAGANDEVIDELTTRDSVRKRIGGPDRRMFLAWEDDQVVGFAATKRIDIDTVELAGIIVLPSYSGRGVGSTLVEAALRGARAESYRSMIVRTETTNNLARAFYEARGFVFGRVTVEHLDDTSVEVWELSRDL